MIRRLGTVLEMIKFQHTVFALPWAAVAALYAAGDGPTPWGSYLWILVAMVGARSAAMAFNRIVDAKLDAENPRTRDRAIPAGRVSVAFTTSFTAVSAAVFLLATWRLNDLCLMLAPAALVVALGYSTTKRFTALCHWILGLALAMAPVGAWLGVRPEWEPLPLLLGAAVLFWIAGADVLYACEDLEFDRRKGLRSVPAALGIRGARIVAILSHLASLGALAAAGVVGRLGIAWHVAVGVIALLLAFEHAVAKPGDLRRMNRAFFHVNAAVSLVLLAGALLDLFVF